MNFRPVAGLLLATCLTGFLAGCASTGDFAIFGEPQTATDKFPRTFQLPEDIDANSIRLATERGTTAYFIAQTSDQNMSCVFAISQDSEADWFSGCGLNGAGDIIVTVSGNQAKNAVTLVTDRADVRDLNTEGWEQIHPNILVLGQ